MEVTPQMLREWMANLFKDTLGFGEFILEKNPNLIGNEILSKLYVLNNKIQKEEPPFLDRKDLLALQHDVMAFFVGWNEKTSDKVLKFYNLNIEMFKHGTSIMTREEHPFKKVLENLQDYSRSTEVVQEILKEYDMKLINKVQFYSLFFAIIVMTQSMEYNFRNDFERRLKLYGIENVDVDELFSLTRKWSNEDGDYDSDIRMMRNAIAHFNFSINYETPPDEFRIIFYPNPKGKEELRSFNDVKFIKFIGDYMMLLKTYEEILSSMIIFRLLHLFYCKDNT